MSLYPETRESLIAQLAEAENREAWARFSELYQPVFYRLGRSRGLQDADAHDLAQQVLISIAQSIPRWEKNNAGVRFRGWLHRIARNTLINALTRKPRDLPVGGSTANLMVQQQAEVVDSGEADFDLEYRRELYRQAAAWVRESVEPDSWRVFEECVVLGKSPGSVAREQAKSIGAVYAVKSRVMRRLRQRIQFLEENEA